MSSIEGETELPQKSAGCETAGEDVEKKKSDKRRRSSFTARRISMRTPFKDADIQLETAVEESNSEEGSGPVASQESSEYTTEQAELAAEINRYCEESSEWDQLLAETEARASAAKQKASEIVLIRDEDVSEEIKANAYNLIGQPPDYSAILQELQQRANVSFSMLDEISRVTELVDDVVQKTDRELTRYADVLGDMSLPSIETPRTQIRQRLATSTPAPKPPPLL